MEIWQLLLSIIDHFGGLAGIWALCIGGITVPRAIWNIMQWWKRKRTTTQQLLVSETEHTLVTHSSTLTQAPEKTDTNALQERLCKLFGFTPDDLQWNKLGEVPDSQATWVRQRAINVFKIYVLLVLLISIPQSIGFFLASSNSLAPVWIICAIASVMILLGWLVLKRTLSFYDVRLVWLKIGPITEKAEIDTNGGLAAVTGYSYSYFVGDVRLPGTWSFPLGLPDLKYHVFYLNTVGKAFLSIEPCVGKHVCSPGVIYHGGGKLNRLMR